MRRRPCPASERQQFVRPLRGRACPFRKFHPARDPHQDSSTRSQTRPILVASSTGTVTSANLGSIYYSRIVPGLLKLVWQAPLVESYAARLLLPTWWSPSSDC